MTLRLCGRAVPRNGPGSSGLKGLAGDVLDQHVPAGRQTGHPEHDLVSLGARPATRGAHGRAPPEWQEAGAQPLVCRTVGQLIRVTERAGGRPGTVVFDLNRSLTGMGHERYRSVEDAVGERPCDVLARRLFDCRGVRAVHVYSNVVTVELEAGASSDGMRDIVTDLFTYYRPGVEVAEPTLAPET